MNIHGVIKGHIAKLSPQISHNRCPPGNHSKHYPQISLCMTFAAIRLGAIWPTQQPNLGSDTWDVAGKIIPILLTSISSSFGVKIHRQQTYSPPKLKHNIHLIPSLPIYPFELTPHHRPPQYQPSKEETFQKSDERQISHGLADHALRDPFETGYIYALLVILCLIPGESGVISCQGWMDGYIVHPPTHTHI